VPTRAVAPYQGAVDADPKGMSCGRSIRTPQRGPEPVVLPIRRSRMEPSPGAGPGLTPYKGAVTTVCDGMVSSVRFERTLPSASCWCLLPLGYEDWSRHPVPTRAICRTKAELQPCAAAELGKEESNLHKRDRLPGQSRTCCLFTPFPIGTGGEIRTHRRPGLSPMPCSSALSAGS
jgi:hypothetical protein